MKQAKKIWNGANVKIRDFLASLCFSGPSFLGMLIFFVAPFCVVIYYSFIAGALDHSFVGLKNYIAVWNNGAFQIAVKNTAVFSGLSVPLAVKYTSSGRQPSADATVLRLSSSRCEASRPMRCRLDGLPNSSHIA